MKDKNFSFISLLVKRALKNPVWVKNIIMQSIKSRFLWKIYFNRLPEPKMIGAVPQDSLTSKHIKQQLIDNGYIVKDFTIDTEDFEQFLIRSRYSDYPDYYFLYFRIHTLKEKALEHYLTSKLLDLNSYDTFIDIANADSPVPEIFEEMFKCSTYRQDLTFPEGVHGNVIGGDAGALPIEDGFASKMSLHCSFEHFQGDSDIRFIREADRILRVGGKLTILPLYLSREYAIQTDPVTLYNRTPEFEKDAVLCAVKGWGNEHGRYYDISHLNSRIRDNLGGLKLTIFHIVNEKEIDPSCYLKFAGLLEKT